MKIKTLFLLPIILLCGCHTPPQQTLKRDYPIKIGETRDAGYLFEIWENPDGTRYLQRGNVRLEIYQSSRNQTSR